MAGKFGVSNLIKVSDVLLEGGNIIDQMMGEEKSGFAKAALAMGIFDELMGLASCDFSLLDDELKELDAEDKAKLVAHFKSKLDLEDDKVEESIEKTFAMALKLAGVATELINMVKSFKKDEASA